MTGQDTCLAGRLHHRLAGRLDSVFELARRFRSPRQRVLLDTSKKVQFTHRSLRQIGCVSRHAGAVGRDVVGCLHVGADRRQVLQQIARCQSRLLCFGEELSADIAEPQADLGNMIGDVLSQVLHGGIGQHRRVPSGRPELTEPSRSFGQIRTRSDTLAERHLERLAKRLYSRVSLFGHRSRNPSSIGACGLRSSAGRRSHGGLLGFDRLG